MEIECLQRNGTFKSQIALDRHNARPRLNYYFLPDHSHFSLPSTFKIGKTKTTCPIHSFVSLYALQLSDRCSWERARKSPRATLPRTWCGQAIRKHVHYSGHLKQEIHPPMYGRQRIKSHTSQLILLRCATTIYFSVAWVCSSRIEANRKTYLLN
jgi:hypothetical protein